MTDLLERRTQTIGRELLESARARPPSRLSLRRALDRLLEWSMSDPAFKVQLFRLIDVFPTLSTAEQIQRHLTEYLSVPGLRVPRPIQWAMPAGAWLPATTAAVIGGAIRRMAGQFIAGADPQAALPRLAGLWHSGVAASVDLLGEVCLSWAEAREYQARYLALLPALAGAARDWPARPVLEHDHLGKIPRANISVKISALDPKVDPIDFGGTVNRLRDVLAPLLTEAAKEDVAVTFDMEHYALKDLTVSLFEQCAAEFPFTAGIALQAYLRSGPSDARRLIEWSRETGRQVSVRLIKGAYWDQEMIRADQMGWPTPVWDMKSRTDACFEEMAAELVAAAPRRLDDGGIKLAVGSHNLRSIAHCLALAEQAGLPPAALEIQMLYGMADALKGAIVGRGLRLREYVPVGPLLPGMSYFVRRLLENASNQSWLRAHLGLRQTAEELLAPPRVEAELAGDRDVVVAEVAERSGREDVGPRTGPAPFRNEPPRDFSKSEVRARFAAAIGKATVPRIENSATAADAAGAVERASAAFPSWRATSADDRAELLRLTAELLRQDRDEIAGLVLREAGKPWREADGDVCEAIDFLMFYASAAPALFDPQSLLETLGERNELWHQPRGVCAVISPWNFPLSICTGMTSAALATGNTVIVKPAEQTPATARRMCEAFWQAGVPVDVLQFLPGQGEVAGAALVRDPRVAMIAFTGSREVGLDLIEAAGRTPQEQSFVKKAVIEMGGKNAIIIDQSADLDEAVAGVRNSAFGYAGQKCSACSRAIVVGDVYPDFVRRLIEATRALVIGDPLDPLTDIGPVIDEAAADKIRSWIEIGRSEGHLDFAGPVPPGISQRLRRPVIGPHIFSGILPDHRLANEEVFGPVLAVMHAAGFGQALRWANATSYKLTGGLFSRTPSHLAAARREFRVGNLYLNRGITGALVGRQPFGGFGLSGSGTKAGGGRISAAFRGAAVLHREHRPAWVCAGNWGMRDILEIQRKVKWARR